MKVKAPSLLKNIIEAFSSKTNELRIRIMIFFLVHKNLDKTASLTQSLHALVSHHHPHHHKKKNDEVVYDEGEYLIENHQREEEERSNANVLMHYNKASGMHTVSNDNDENNMSHMEDDYSHMSRICEAIYNEEKPITSGDLTHALFKESEAELEKENEVEDVAYDGDRAMGMVEDAEEEDIDQAADMFIQRFKRQMQLQKQLSLERHEGWLLQSNA